MERKFSFLPDRPHRPYVQDRISDEEVAGAIKSVPKHFSASQILDIPATGIFGTGAPQGTSVAIGAAAGLLVSGVGSDFQKGNNVVNALITVGSVPNSNPSITIQVQESVDGSTWTNVSDPSGLATAITASNTRLWIKFMRSKRYLGAYATVTGSGSTAYTVGVEFVGQAYETGSGGGFTLSPQT